MKRFQPYWATRAHLLRAIGRHEEAQAAYDKAIALTTSAPMRVWLQGERDQTVSPG